MQQLALIGGNVDGGQLRPGVGLPGGVENRIGEVESFTEVAVDVDPDFLSFFGHGSCDVPVKIAQMGRGPRTGCPVRKAGARAVGRSVEKTAVAVKTLQMGARTKAETHCFTLERRLCYSGQVEEKRKI